MESRILDADMDVHDWGGPTLHATFQLDGEYYDVCAHRNFLEINEHQYRPKHWSLVFELLLWVATEYRPERVKRDVLRVVFGGFEEEGDSEP